MRKRIKKHIKNIGKQMSMFEKIPSYSVYVPNEEAYQIEALIDVYILDGNTSSYPPHKHDSDNLPYGS